MTLLEKKYLLKDGSINYAVLHNEAEPLRELEFSFENFKVDFSNGKVQTPIGEVFVGVNQLRKLKNKEREQFLGLIKPTLENPNFIVDFEDTTCFFKAFKDKNNIVKFISVIKDRNNEMLDVVSNYSIKNHKLELLVRSGKLLYIKNEIARNPCDSRSSGIVTSDSDIIAQNIKQNSKSSKNRFENLVIPDDLRNNKAGKEQDLER